MKKPQIINQYEEDNLYEQIIPRALNSPQLISPYQYQRECDKLRENIDYMKLDYAQAQSDKIELMRDLATYQSQVCDHIDIATKMSTLKDIAKKTLEKCTKVGVQSEMFQDKLFDIVDQGVNRQNAKICLLKYTKELIQKRKVLKK